MNLSLKFSCICYWNFHSIECYTDGSSVILRLFLPKSYTHKMIKYCSNSNTSHFRTTLFNSKIKSFDLKPPQCKCHFKQNYRIVALFVFELNGLALWSRFINYFKLTCIKANVYLFIIYTIKHLYIEKLLKNKYEIIYLQSDFWTHRY